MQRFLRRSAPFASLVLVAILTVVGGWINTVDARGRVVDDTDDSPVANLDVHYGSRVTITGPDGSYVMTSLPRNARLQAQKPGYSRSSASADATVFRLVPLTITFEVKDEATGKGVDTPEARQPASVRIGQGSASGEMVIGPYPPRDRPVLICAKGYDSKEVLARGVLMDVLLKAGAEGCPPLPTPVAPAQVPSPSAPAVPPASPAAPSPSASP